MFCHGTVSMLTHVKAIFIAAMLLVAVHALAAPSEEAFSPVPTETKARPEQALGKALFQDKRLSKDGKKSCQTCHQPDDAFKQPFHGGLDTPTLLNVTLNDRFFWNGRTRLLEEAVLENLNSPEMMGNDLQSIKTVIENDPKLTEIYKQWYESPVTIDNIVDSLIAYLDTLKTPGAPFDKFIQGDKQALSEEETKGYQLFVNYGCSSCHQGKNIGGNLTEKLGIYDAYFKDDAPNKGLYDVTKKEKDKFVFRVPSLRNVEKTAPYFHDGTAHTLDEAVKQMAKYQLNRTLRQDEVDNIVAFLKTLTGKMESN